MNAQLKPNNIENRKQLSKPGIFSYIQQYKTQGPSLVNKTIDLFHQLGTVLNEHDNNTNNPDIMRKLVHQVKIAPPQEELCGVCHSSKKQSLTFGTKMAISFILGPPKVNPFSIYTSAICSNHGIEST